MWKMDVTLRQSRKETQTLSAILPLVLAARPFDPKMAEEETDQIKLLQRDRREEEETERFQVKMVQTYMMIALGEMSLDIQGYGNVKIQPLTQYTMGTYTRSSAIPTNMNPIVAPNGFLGTMVTSQSDEFTRTS